MPAALIPDVLSALRAGRMIVLVDDENRENEGDLVCAAERVTPESVNFVVHEARGLLCVALAAEACDRLELYPQAIYNTAPLGTAFTVSVDGHPKHGITTGVSAAERATRRSSCLLMRPPCRGFVTAGAYFSIAGAAGRGARAGRADRGIGGFMPACGAQGGCGDHRNHGRGRHDGPAAGAQRVLRQAWLVAGDHRRSDRIPASAGYPDTAHREPADRITGRKFTLRVYETVGDPLIAASAAAASAIWTHTHADRRHMPIRFWSACIRSICWGMSFMPPEPTPGHRLRRL